MQVHSGKVHFATDAWTSPNHRAFVAWTVHLHDAGHILAFLLDVVEVPEVRRQLLSLFRISLQSFHSVAHWRSPRKGISDYVGYSWSRKQGTLITLVIP
jgi:hypothetical protein